MLCVATISCDCRGGWKCPSTTETGDNSLCSSGIMRVVKNQVEVDPGCGQNSIRSEILVIEFYPHPGSTSAVKDLIRENQLFTLASLRTA